MFYTWTCTAAQPQRSIGDTSLSAKIIFFTILNNIYRLVMQLLATGHFYGCFTPHQSIFLLTLRRNL